MFGSMLNSKTINKLPIADQFSVEWLFNWVIVSALISYKPRLNAYAVFVPVTSVFPRGLHNKCFKMMKVTFLHDCTKRRFSTETQLSCVDCLAARKFPVPQPPNWDPVDSLHLLKSSSIFAFLMCSLVANVLSYSSGSHKSDCKAGVLNFGQVQTTAPMMEHLAWRLSCCFTSLFLDCRDNVNWTAGIWQT